MYSSRRRLSLSRAIDKQPEEQIGIQEKICRFLGTMRISEMLACFMVFIPVLLVIIAMSGYEQGNGFVEASRIIQIKPETNVTSSDDSTLQRDQKQKGKAMIHCLTYSILLLLRYLIFL